MEMKHWFKPDGSHDHAKIAQDSFFMQNKDAIIKLVYEQGIAKGKESEDIENRNITLNDPRKTMDSASTGNDGIVVEGAENFGSQKGAKIRFGK